MFMVQKRKRFSPEEKVRLLIEGEAVLKAVLENSCLFWLFAYT